MAGLTKKAIKQSVLKLLNEKPVSKITVKDIVEDCGINRNTFYYHYADLPTLIEEIINEEADRIIREHAEITSLEECLEVAVSVALRNKTAVLHIHNSQNREIYETYLWKVCDHAVRTYIEQAFANTPLSQGDREILIRYHKCEGFGQIIDWLNHGMRTDIMVDFCRICELRRGTAAELLDKLR